MPGGQPIGAANEVRGAARPSPMQWLVCECNVCQERVAAKANGHNTTSTFDCREEDEQI